MNLNLGWLSCAQNVYRSNACLRFIIFHNDKLCLKFIIFHNDKQMFLNLLFNSLTSEEDRNAIFYI